MTTRTAYARWYVSVYDRESNELIAERPLQGVDDDSVRSTFGANPGAVGGFEVQEEHLAFVQQHSGSAIDLRGQVAFVELLGDLGAGSSHQDPPAR